MLSLQIDAARLPSRALPVPPAGRRTPAALLALLVLLVVAGLAAAAPAAHAADRAFTPRFSTNDTGDIEMFGNTLMTCPVATKPCDEPGQGRNITSPLTSGTDYTQANNGYNMVYVDQDSDASTFNSSFSNVSLPSGSTVLYAGLYWGGRVASGSAAFNARNTVKFKAPGDSGYSTLTATQVDDASSANVYQGFVDVTDRVKAAGGGQYAVGNVQSATGADQLAGWTLVIAYRDTSQPARNLTIFDGMKSVSSNGATSIGVSGFKTPPAGPVKTTVGFVTYEGDSGIAGDSASLNGKVLSDGQHPATNFFDSRSSRGGVLSTGNTPSYANNLGYEHAMLSVGNDYVDNNDTSATVGLTTNGDVYAPGVVTFATDLYAPKVEQTKTVVDDNGGQVEQGDVLTYTIKGTNSGQDGATSFVLRDPLPANVGYVGPLTIKQRASASASETTTTATPATGDDLGEVDSAGRRVVARLGTGATSSTGGTLAVGGTYEVSFKVRVGGPSPAVPSNTTIQNVATSSFNSQSLGTALTAESSAASTVKSPDLTIVKRRSGDLVRGQTGTYTIDVRNDGDAKTQGQVTVRDQLPAGLTATAASGAGWDCTVTAGDVACTRSDALAPGAPYPTITVTVDVTDDVPNAVANSATVSGGGDGNVGNNTSTDTSVAQSRADLAIQKTTDDLAPAVGGTVAYALKVTNNGPSRSTGSTITDTLPAGLTFVSSSSCTGVVGGSTVTCAVPAIASGASRTVELTARVAVGRAGMTLRNTAAVAGNEPDPTSGNDRDAVDVQVKPVDLAITGTIQAPSSQPSPSALDAGSTYTWLLDVKNLGGSPAASTTVTFPVPSGTTVASSGLDPRCTVGGGVVTCDLGQVGAGASSPQIAVPLAVAGGGSAPAAVQTIATVRSAETDADTANNSARTDTPVRTAVDLRVGLTSDPGTTSAGDTLKLVATVTNAGPATPAAPTVTIAIPSGTTFVRADPGCTPNGAGTAVVCALSPSDLGPGGSTSKSVTVAVGTSPGDTVDATATVATTSQDTDPSNDTAALAVPVVKVAGLSITKTASTGQAKPGDTVTYALRASNTGAQAAAAKDVVATDTLPSGVTFVSVDDPACTYAAATRTVSCDFGTLAAGASRSATIAVAVDTLSGAFDASAVDQIDVTKVEANLAVEPGRSASANASCPSGYVATDGSVRIDHVDQGTGTLSDAKVLASAATADGRGWTGRVQNDTTGQLQVKVEVVCLTAATTGAQHHPLLVSDQQSATRTWGPGSHDVVLACGAGRVAVAPSVTFANGFGVVRTSQREGATGWRFTVDVPESADAVLGVRCLSTTTGAVAGHVHDLLLGQMTTVTVTVPAGGTADAPKLTCPNDGKGIVASTDMDRGLRSLGNDPQPVSRVFGFYNPTDRPLTARISLLCLDTHTSGELGVRTIANTASVRTSTSDATAADDSATASFVATPASGDTGTTPSDPAPAPAPAPVPVPRPAAPADAATPAPAAAPTPAPAARATVLASSLRVTGTTSKASIALPLRCAAACSGTAKLVALRTVKGAAVKKGATLATASLRLAAGKQATVRLKAKGKAARALRLGRVRTARLVVTTGRGTTVVRTVKLARR